MVAANDKRFDPELARECDPKSKRATCEVCVRIGYSNLRDNPEDQYTGHIYDIVAELSGKEIRFETELKKEWGEMWSQPGHHPDVPYKWPTMDYPWRKRDKGLLHADIHDVVGRDSNRVFRVLRQVITESPVESKFCRNRGEEEPFFRVALPAPCSFFWHRVNGVWQVARAWDRDLNLVLKDGERLQ